MLSSFLDVDHVEVLRGPQGTLFGRNATVGAISVTTVAPSFGGDSGEVSAEGGNYNSYKLEGIGNLAVGGEENGHRKQRHEGGEDRNPTIFHEREPGDRQ